MATRKRTRSQPGKSTPKRRGALAGLRGGFRRAARSDRQLVWIFWGLLAIFVLMFALSFVRP